jgi:malate/lactate dehydrogenase
MVGLSATAQEVVIDFNTIENNWNLPTTKTIAETSYTYDGYTIKIAGTSGKSEGFAWNSITNQQKEVVGHYLILGKNGVEKVIEVNLNEEEKSFLETSAEAVKKGIGSLATLLPELA